MTRIHEIEKDEFSLINEGQQSFIVLKNDKIGIKSGDTLILQLVPEEEGAGIEEVTMKVDFFLTEGLKAGYVVAAIKEPSYA